MNNEYLEKQEQLDSEYQMLIVMNQAKSKNMVRFEDGFTLHLYHT